LFVDWKKDS